MPWRRARPAALLLLVLGVVVVLSAASRPWVRALLSPEQAAGAGVAVRLEAGGRQAAPVAVALALAAAACGVAALLTGPRARRALGVLLVLVSAGGAAAAAGVLTEPAAAVADRGRALGVDAATLDAVARVSGWAWAGTFAWLLPLLAGLAVAAATGGGPRSDRGAAPARTTDAGTARPADVWEALNRGQDPT